MYDRILVPTDGSAGSRRAIEHAIELAGLYGATVDALYVVNTVSFTSLPMEASWEGVNDLLRDEGADAIAEVERLGSDHGVDVRRVVLEGSPSRKIVTYAEREGCDLIVMGTHGRGGIDRLLLGSVAERVVRSSQIPVLTLRAGDPDTEPD